MAGVREIHDSCEYGRIIEFYDLRDASELVSALEAPGGTARFCCPTVVKEQEMKSCLELSIKLPQDQSQDPGALDCAVEWTRVMSAMGLVVIVSKGPRVGLCTLPSLRSHLFGLEDGADGQDVL